MLKLASPREPYWLDLLSGVRVQLRPVTVASMLIARQAAADALARGGDHAAVEAGIAFTRSLALSAIVAWSGIGDADGEPVEATPETVGSALDVFAFFDAIDRLYAGPALGMVNEKNA